jgi:hypothetical protein
MEHLLCVRSRILLCALSTPRPCTKREPDPLRAKGFPEMKHTRSMLSLTLLSALFLSAGALTLRAAAAQQSGDQTDSSPAKKSPESKQTPPAAPAPAAKPAPAANTPATSKPAAAQQTRPANSSGMVWVNTDSGIYHKPGTRYFGKTKHGKYMTEADAIKAGYRAAGKN